MATLTAPRRRRLTLRLPKLDTRLVVGLLLVAVSVAAGLRLSDRPDHAVAVLAARQALPAGHVLTADDLIPTRVDSAPAALRAFVAATAPSPRGRVLREPVATGALLPRRALGAEAPRGREVTVPITPEHALGGALVAGDRVDVLSTFDKGTELARTITVARRARVVDVVRSEGLFGQREGALTALTLAVDPDDAVYVVFAARNGELDVVRAAVAGDGSRGRFDFTELP
jgi:Flp pilus assembly protein CpaB